VAYQKERLFYNGVTLDEISGPDATTKLGTHGKLKVPSELCMIAAKS